MQPNEKSDFFHLKGHVVAILNRLGVSRFTESPIKNDLFSEGLTIKLGKTKLVDLGLVKKSIIKHFDISEVIKSSLNGLLTEGIVEGYNIKHTTLVSHFDASSDASFKLTREDTSSKEALYSESHITSSISSLNADQNEDEEYGSKDIQPIKSRLRKRNKKYGRLASTNS